MKRIILSLAVIAVVAVVSVSATRAFFSDTATITGNTFTSGTMDLRIDKNPSPSVQDWNNGFANPYNPFANVKPGDEGEQIIDIKNIGSVNGKATIKFSATSWSALADNLNFTVYYDAENNGFADDTTAIATGLLSAWNNNTYQLGNLGADKIGSVKIVWSVPTTAGNNIQGATITLDTVFGLEQKDLVFTLTHPSEANLVNQTAPLNGLPYFTYVINGSSIDLTLVNPTGHNVWFDYVIDGEPGSFEAGTSDIVLSQGPLSGQTIGNLYHPTKVTPAEGTKTITVTGANEIKVGMRFGPEQHDYLDWATFTAN